MKRSILLVGLAICVSAVVRAWIVSNSGGPIIANDEWFYAFNAKNLFSFQGYYSVLYPPAYPLLLSPMYFFGDRFYEAGLAINALLSALLAVPVFLLARQTMRPGWAAFTAILSLFLPFQFVFAPRILMAENLSWPLFALACWGLVAGVDARASRAAAYDGMFGVLAAALALTKYNFLVAIPVLLVLRAAFLRVYVPWPKVLARISLGIAGAAFVWAPWAAYGRISGLSFADVFGLTTAASEFGRPRLYDLPFWLTVDLLCTGLILLPMLPPFFAPWIAHPKRILALRNLKTVAEELCNPWIRQQIVALGFFAAFFSLTVVHDITIFWFNIERADLLESRYFEFVQPLFLVCAVHGALDWFRSPTVSRSSMIAMGLWSAVTLVAAGLGYLLITGSLGGAVTPWFASAPGSHTVTLLTVTAPAFCIAWFGFAVVLAAALSSRRGATVAVASAAVLAIVTAITGSQMLANYSVDEKGFSMFRLHAKGFANAIGLNRSDTHWFLALPSEIAGPDRPSPHTQSYFATFAVFWSAWQAQPELLDHKHGRLRISSTSSHDQPTASETQISIFTHPQSSCIGSYVLPGSAARFFVCKLEGADTSARP